MNEEEAVARATAGREAHGVIGTWRYQLAERRIIEQAEAPPERGPVRVRDRRVWVVRFVGDCRWAELAVDDETGEIVRVQKARGGCEA